MHASFVHIRFSLKDVYKSRVYKYKSLYSLYAFRLTACSFQYNPQALHTGSPFAFLRHNVVCVVPQFAQLVPARRAAD